MPTRVTTLVLTATALIAPLASCRQEGPPTRAAAPDTAPFVELARQADCAGTRNRLFVIDRTMVFWDRAGNCPDNSYPQRLYGSKPPAPLAQLPESHPG